MKTTPARFITLEGIEGVGKSTQLKFVAGYLQQAHIPLTITREPGGTPIAEAIRSLLLQSDFSPEMLVPETELLLFFAARAQHIHYVIKPALQRGDWVLCDRFTETSYAYQGGGRGIDVAFIRSLHLWVQQDLNVNVVLLLDAPVDIALRRMRHRKTADRIEAEKHDFFTRARASYLERAQQRPDVYQVIDASRSLKDVQKQIKNVLDRLLHLWVKSDE
ncbi:dTMP kinase [Rickettsiella grylli]|uniref:dTMP kinase n=1 Tax=Rickettsiella grylli TaxID=59196 RepID=UPI0008FD8014|nr:dTMP kinase [Rickettsiella grylli]OJA00787.1 dTMP kinase [Rickettsiella grylli]